LQKQKQKQKQQEQEQNNNNKNNHNHNHNGHVKKNSFFSSTLNMLKHAKYVRVWRI
jgi:hypothetical protein